MTAPSLEFVDEPMPPEPEVAPKKRGRPKGPTNRGTTSDRAPRRNSRTWVRAQCATIIGAANMVLVTIPATAADALNEKEMDLLADALTAEAMTNERIMSWMERAAKVSPHFLMIRALYTIAVPRLQRRGLLPTPPVSEEQIAEWQAAGMTLEEIMRKVEANGATATPETPVSVETGATSHNNW